MKEPATQSTTPATIEEYLAGVPADKRAALEHLRAVIRSAVPAATEGFSYGVPGFKLQESLVSYAAAKNHCSFYPQSSAVIEAFKEELQGFDTSPGTIRFKPERPLPDELVKRLVAARIAENDARKSR